MVVKIIISQPIEDILQQKITDFISIFIFVIIFIFVNIITNTFLRDDFLLLA